MATIANLDINLGARVAGFENGMKTAQKSIKNLQSSVSAAGSKLAAWTKGMAVAAAGALAAKFSFDALHRSFEKIDQISKASDTFGMSTESLTSLRLAAQMADVSVETLQKAMLKSGMTLSEFAQAADAISQIGDAQERNAIATALFGKQALELMPLLNEGGDAIREAEENMKRFGFAANSIEAKGVELMNDKLDLLSLSFTGIIDKIAVEAAPIISTIADMFLDAGFNAQSMGEIIEAAMDVAKLAIASAANSWAIWGAPIKIATALVLELVSTVTAGISKLAALANSIHRTEIGTQIEKITGDISKSTHKFGKGMFDNALEQFMKGITGQTFTETMAGFEKNRLAAEGAAGRTRPKGAGFFDDMTGGSKSDRAAGPAAALEKGTAAAASAILKGRNAVTEGEKITHKALNKNNELMMRLIRAQELGGVAVAEL